MLSAKYIVKTREGREILRLVSIDIEPGTITSLVGPSGAGKTTLLCALSFSDTPEKGSIDVEGISYPFPHTEKAPSPSPMVALVFQELFLWPHLTLRENITLSNRAANAEVAELISTFEMQDFIDRYPNQTSLGQRQRAALARAIALKPRYLLLDEVTSALDIEQIEAVAIHLEKLKDRGIGILVVTHLIHFAQRISDKILFMDKGEIIERGGKELISNPRHQRTKDFLKYF